ncbi:hypothetical protein V8G54_019929 [Vigna mungo]|uniref:RNA-dependent RNA polymerase n=1 Tax=Vigna mungo TaxID=3915 RepID=A0AAQ3NDE2_VIGMU
MENRVSTTENRVSTMENRVSALEGRFGSMEATLEEIRAKWRGMARNANGDRGRRNINRDRGRRRNQRRSSEGSCDSFNTERKRQPPEKLEDEAEEDRGDVQRSGMKRVELPTFEEWTPWAGSRRQRNFSIYRTYYWICFWWKKTRHPNWKMFMEALTRRFGRLNRGTVLKKLAAAQQKGSVEEYTQEFEILVAQASGEGMAEVRQEGSVNASGGQEDEEDEKINNLLDLENMGKGMGETELKLSIHQPPLLLRYRLFHMGHTIKGTLLVNKKLFPRIIQVRHSMIKVEKDLSLNMQSINSLEVVNTSIKPNRTYLSKNLITLLSYGGVLNEFFKVLLESNLEDANQASINNGTIDKYIAAEMILYGIPLDEPFLQYHLCILAREEPKKLRGGKLDMPECFYLMGIVDPIGCLEKDQDCIIHGNGQITRDVLVYRNPGLHFGYIHIMRATYVDNLESFVGHNKYANFFPCVGTRLVADFGLPTYIKDPGQSYKIKVSTVNEYFGAVAEERNSRGHCFMSRNVRKTIGAPVLIALVVSKAAIDGQSLSTSDHVKHALKVLQKFVRQDSVPEQVAYVMTNWVACQEQPDTVGGTIMSGLREAVSIIDVLSTGKDYMAEVEALEATRGQSDTGKDEGRDIIKRLDAVGSAQSSLAKSIYEMLEVTRRERMHGFGIYHFANGHLYEGAWHEGRRQGLGMYTFRNGETQSGHWQNGLLDIPSTQSTTYPVSPVGLSHSKVLNAVQRRYVHEHFCRQIRKYWGDFCESQELLAIPLRARRTREVEARRAASKAYEVAKVDEGVNRAVAASNRAANAARVAAVKAAQKRMHQVNNESFAIPVM